MGEGETGFSGVTVMSCVAPSRRTVNLIGVVGMVLEPELDLAVGVNRLAVHLRDLVAGLEAGGLSRAVGRELFDDDRAVGGADADLARGAALPPGVVVLDVLLRATVKVFVSSPRWTTIGMVSAVLVTMRQMTESPMPMK